MRKKYKLREALTYTPEKELEFIEKAKKDLESVKRIFINYHGKVFALTVDDLVKNTEMVENLKEKVDQAFEATGKITTANIKILDMYPADQENENIDTLMKINDSIDDYYFKLMNLDTVLGDLIESVEKLKRPDFEVQ